MSEPAESLGQELESHASSRADFRQLSAKQRTHIAKSLVIARSQVDTGNENEMRLIDVKCGYFYKCGAYGLDLQEAQSIWWSVVYENPSPAERREYV